MAHSVLDDILEKAFSGKLSTDETIATDDERWSASIRDQTHLQTFQQSPVEPSSRALAEGFRFQPSVPYSYAWRTENTASSRPARNHRLVESSLFHGVDLVAEGINGSVKDSTTFVTDGWQIGGYLSKSPNGLSVGDLRLVVQNTPAGSNSQSNLGSYPVQSVSGEEVSVPSGTFDTGGNATTADYKYAVVAPHPIQTLPVPQSSGDAQTYFLVQPDHWPVLQTDEDGTTEGIAKATASINTNVGLGAGTLVVVTDESYQTRSIGDLAQIGNIIFVVADVSDNGGNDQLDLVPFRDMDAQRPGLSAPQFAYGTIRFLYSVNDFRSSPYQSPGTLAAANDHLEAAVGENIRALWNNPSVIDAIRIRPLVDPTMLEDDRLERGCGAMLTDNPSGGSGYGVTLIPSDGSGGFEMASAIHSRRDLTIDPNVSDDQQVWIDYQEGVIHLSHPIPTSGQTGDLNPNGSSNPQLYVTAMEYTDAEAPEAARQLESERKDGQRIEANTRDRRSNLNVVDYGEPIEGTQGWIVRPNDDSDDTRRIYHRKSTADNNYTNYPLVGGYNPAVGFSFFSEDKSTTNRTALNEYAIEQSLRFQYHDPYNQVWKTGGIRIGRHNQMIFTPEEDISWNHSATSDFRLSGRPRAQTNLQFGGTITGVSDDQFNARINGETVQFNYITSTEDNNNNGSYIENDDGDRHITNEIVPEIIGKIEANSNLTHNEDFWMFAETDSTIPPLPSNPYYPVQRLVLEASDYLEILTLNDPYFTQGRKFSYDMGIGFGYRGVNSNNPDQMLQWRRNLSMLELSDQQSNANQASDIRLSSTDEGMAGPTGFMNKGLDRSYLRGFDIDSANVVDNDTTDEVEIPIEAGVVQITPFGTHGKTVEKIPSKTVKLPNGTPEQYIVYADTSQYPSSIGFVKESAGVGSIQEKDIPLYRIGTTPDELIFGGTDTVSHPAYVDDLRPAYQGLQYSFPIVCGDTSDKYDLNFRDALEIVRTHKYHDVNPDGGPGHLTIELRADATCPLREGLVTIPEGTTIEGNGNSIILGTFGTGTGVEAVSYDVNGWKTTERRVVLTDNTGDVGDYTVTIDVNGTSDSFTVTDGTLGGTSSGSDDTDALAFNLAGQIDGATINGETFKASRPTTTDGDIFIDVQGGRPYTLNTSTTDTQGFFNQISANKYQSGLFRCESHVTVQNVEFRVSDPGWGSRHQTLVNGSPRTYIDYMNGYFWQAPYSFNSKIIRDVTFQNCRFLSQTLDETSTSQSFRHINLSDNTGNKGDFDVELSVGASSKTFTVTDSDPGTDDTTTLADDLATNISNENDLNGENFEATHIGNGEIVIEGQNRQGFTINLSTTDGSGSLTRQTDQSRNILHVSRKRVKSDEQIVDVKFDNILADEGVLGLDVGYPTIVSDHNVLEMRDTEVVQIDIQTNTSHRPNVYFSNVKTKLPHPTHRTGQTVSIYVEGVHIEGQRLTQVDNTQGKSLVSMPTTFWDVTGTITDSDFNLSTSVSTPGGLIIRDSNFHKQSDTSCLTVSQAIVHSAPSEPVLLKNNAFEGDGSDSGIILEEDARIVDCSFDEFNETGSDENEAIVLNDSSTVDSSNSYAVNNTYHSVTPSSSQIYLIDSGGSITVKGNIAFDPT